LAALILLLIFAVPWAHAEETPDWSRGAAVPVDGRANPYGAPADQLARLVHAGRLHALSYPVSVTGLILPYQAIGHFLAADSLNPLRQFVQKIATGLSHFHDYDDIEAWLGLHRFPTTAGEGPYDIPVPENLDGHRMGFTLMNTPSGAGFTISCAQCHTANLFGRRVLGLTNRFPRANALFTRGLAIMPYVSPGLFAWATSATPGEKALFARARTASRFIAARKPIQLGLDTSLAQVALSLDKRAPDEWATRQEGYSGRGGDPIARQIADSKPAVWWNVKYKDRWLSDGSVVSGNPIYTNFLWNEIGRGTDLHELDTWFTDNEPTVRELTSAVFAAEAPRYTDFFPAETLDEGRARHGEQVFLARCARCHGVYEKAWSLPGAEQLTWGERLRTVHVHYRTPTPVVDVGTDPNRYLGMRALVRLNDLEISRRQNIVIEPQTGYVPPPLVGIWARWPYFHNNSAPSLCAVLTRSERRPVQYWARPAADKQTDFDQPCNGYPAGRPAADTPRAYLYDTRREGMHASGHDERIFLKDGQELLTAQDKADLIVFLQTL
jgi:mono/diheme cytochrome c family protein